MNTERIDFEKLALKDALDLAILIEADARDRYVELAGQLRLHQRSPRAVLFFEQMARMEEAHHAALSAQRLDRFPGAPCTVALDQIEDLEGPRIDDARVRMSLRDALEAALDAEKRAEEFFTRALACVKDPEVVRLFSDLRAEESQHRTLVGDQLQHAPLPRAASIPFL